jgi:hypothetical protein
LTVCFWKSYRGPAAVGDDGAIAEIGDLPPAPESAIKIHEIDGNLGVAVGEIIFALQQLALCRGDIEEVDRPLRVPLPRRLQSSPIFGDRPAISARLRCASR